MTVTENNAVNFIRSSIDKIINVLSHILCKFLLLYKLRQSFGRPARLNLILNNLYRLVQLFLFLHIVTYISFQRRNGFKFVESIIKSVNQISHLLGSRILVHIQTNSLFYGHYATMNLYARILIRFNQHRLRSFLDRYRQMTILIVVIKRKLFEVSQNIRVRILNVMNQRMCSCFQSGLCRDWKYVWI